MHRALHFLAGLFACEQLEPSVLGRVGAELWSGSGLVAVVTQALDSMRGGNGSVVLSTQTKTFVTQMEGSRGLWVSDQKQNPDVNEGETQTKSTRVKKRFLSSVHSVPQPPVSP